MGSQEDGLDHAKILQPRGHPLGCLQSYSQDTSREEEDGKSKGTR